MRLASTASKLRKEGPKLLFAATVATQLPAVVAAKFSATVPLFPDKYVYLISRFLGPDLTKKIVGSVYHGNYAPGLSDPNFGLQPFGWANGTTFSGGLILLVDYLIKMVGIMPYYSKVSPFIRAVADGLLVSGGIGGVLDPPAEAGGNGGRGSVSHTSVSVAAIASTAGRSIGASGFSYKQGALGQ